MKQERGFALLLVFVMAAAIAITLYKELPRVAFEAQRNREQLLIDRGEQYSRAIQLYVRKMKTYPSSIDQLEKANQIRFLRKRYADPMTGKSEWRAIHINAGGVYTDSLTHKPPTPKGEEKSVNTFTYEAAATGSIAPPTNPSDAGFPQARPSERAGLPPMPGQAPPVDPANPQPGASPFPVIPTGVAIPPGAYNPGGVNPQPGQPGQQGQLIQPGQPFPGQLPGPTGVVQPGQPFPQPGPGGGIQPGQPFPQPGAPPDPNGQNQALAMINNMLTNPRPVAQTGAPQQTGLQLGGGIAGFASTVERTGIKIYNEMEKYNEWEFIYDPTKDTSMGAGALPQQQRTGQQTPQTPQTPQQPPR